MEFWVTIIELLRRTRVVIPVLAVALTSALLAFVVTPASYVSNATMVLTLTQFGGTESRDPSAPTDLTNPMLNFNDSLITTSAILINAMNSKEVTQQLDAEESTVIIDDGRSDPDLLGLNGPFLHIQVESTSGNEAARVANDAQALIRQELLEWQEELDAPKATYIRLVDVVPPGVPEVNRSRPAKFGMLAGVSGFGLGLAIAYLRHRISVRRPSRPLAPAAATAPPRAARSQGRRATRPAQTRPVQPRPVQPRPAQTALPAEPTTPPSTAWLPPSTARVPVPDVSESGDGEESVLKVPVKTSKAKRR